MFSVFAGSTTNQLFKLAVEVGNIPEAAFKGCFGHAHAAFKQQSAGFFDSQLINVFNCAYSCGLSEATHKIAFAEM